MEDIGDDEVADWGVIHPMSSVQVALSPHALSWSQPSPVAGQDVAPGLESTTQVNSAEGRGRVSGELLDALERDLNVVVAPKRRVRRVFNDNVESVVQQSRGRFQALSSDEELARGELPTQVDRESSVFDMKVADSPDEDEDRVVQPVDVSRGRRVVLIPQSALRSVHNMSDEGSNESDTDSLDLEENGSVVSGVEEPPPIEDVIEMDEVQGTLVGFREALQAIDEVNLDVVFRRRANVIKWVPHILKGPYRNAMKVLLEEIVAGHDRGDILRQEEGWKAFMLLPRLLRHRKCRGGKIGKEKLRERFDGFRAGRWASLLAESVENDEEAARVATRKRRTQLHGDLEHRISRAMTRIQLGELTAGRQALEADLAPGTEATLRELRQRPQMPRDPIPPEILNHVPQRGQVRCKSSFCEERHCRWTVRNDHRAFETVASIPNATCICSLGWENCWSEVTSLKTSQVCCASFGGQLCWRRSEGYCGRGRDSSVSRQNCCPAAVEHATAPFHFARRGRMRMRGRTAGSE